jgi:hypothetical protein
MTALEKIASNETFEDKFSEILKMLDKIWQFAIKSKDEELIKQVMVSIGAINGSVIEKLKESDKNLLEKSLKTICDGFCSLEGNLKIRLERDFLNSFEGIFENSNEVRRELLKFCEYRQQKQGPQTRGDSLIGEYSKTFFVKLASMANSEQGEGM